MTWGIEQRKLAAILAADIAGYSALMGSDEGATVRDLKGHQAVVLPMIETHAGRVIDTAGDGILAEFASVLNAVKCAIAIQRVMAERNVAVDPSRRMQFRIGVNLGDVIFDEKRIYGDGINVAARLESIAEPGNICISDKVYREVRGKIDVAVRDLGPKALKNIEEPIRVYALNVAKGSDVAIIRRRSPPQPTRPLPDRPSLAVLPFINASSDGDEELFGDEIAEGVLTELSKLRGLLVIDRISSFIYRGKAIDVTQVSRELGVRYVLHGSVKRADQRVRISAQLTDAMTVTPVWAENYGRDSADTYAVQGEISSAVSAVIQPTLILFGPVSLRTPRAKRTHSKPEGARCARVHCADAILQRDATTASRVALE